MTLESTDSQKFVNWRENKTKTKSILRGMAKHKRIIRNEDQG